MHWVSVEAHEAFSYGMWNPVPRRGTEPRPPALAAGILATGPLGKSHSSILKFEKIHGGFWHPRTLKL